MKAKALFVIVVALLVFGTSGALAQAGAIYKLGVSPDGMVYVETHVGDQAKLVQQTGQVVIEGEADSFIWSAEKNRLVVMSGDSFTIFALSASEFQPITVELDRIDEIAGVFSDGSFLVLSGQHVYHFSDTGEQINDFEGGWDARLRSHGDKVSIHSRDVVGDGHDAVFQIYDVLSRESSEYEGEFWPPMDWEVGSDWRMKIAEIGVWDITIEGSEVDYRPEENIDVSWSWLKLRYRENKYFNYSLMEGLRFTGRRDAVRRTVFWEDSGQFFVAGDDEVHVCAFDMDHLPSWECTSTIFFNWAVAD